jgi:hypothetical protein
MGQLDAILPSHDALNYPENHQKQDLSPDVLWQAMSCIS